ncbi:hypothetical protein OP10G_0477 [Fimbriimonas ginsengisoli Gsoil 348]|uniref:MalT-like TPR region domain-containing protein n=1 Tax=Fimbriimonas ginsengisoli Gsoil 348 TaxID=661478 RepID=A0A068NM33_FIMGI|nr:hypothetical protein OP10G_0477 [Fimbriimonas ginsengisoli Gsoil 348]
MVEAVKHGSDNPPSVTERDALSPFLPRSAPSANESPDRIIERTREAIEAARAGGNPIAEAAASSDLCVMLREAGRLNEAIEAGYLALELSNRENAFSEKTQALLALSGCYLHIGNPRTAFSYLAEAESTARRYGSRDEIAEVLLSQSASFGRVRNPEKALEYALLVKGEFGNDLSDIRRSSMCNNIAASLNDLGRYAESLPYVDEGLASLTDPGQELSRAFLLGNKAVALSHAGEIDSVLAIVRQVEELAERHGRQILVAGLMEELGVSYFKLGHSEQARVCLERAKAVAESLSLKNIVRTVCKHLAQVYEELGLPEEAGRDAQDCLDYRRGVVK